MLVVNQRARGHGEHQNQHERDTHPQRQSLLEQFHRGQYNKTSQGYDQNPKIAMKGGEKTLRPCWQQPVQGYRYLSQGRFHVDSNTSKGKRPECPRIGRGQVEASMAPKPLTLPL